MPKYGKIKWGAGGGGIFSDNHPLGWLCYSVAIFLYGLDAKKKGGFVLHTQHKVDRSCNHKVVPCQVCEDLLEHGVEVLLLHDRSGVEDLHPHEDKQQALHGTVVQHPVCGGGGRGSGV